MDDREIGVYALILTNGLFSMEGDLALVENLATLFNANDVWLMIDDAAGIGNIGRAGAQALLKAARLMCLFKCARFLEQFGSMAAICVPVSTTQKVGIQILLLMLFSR